MDSRLKSDLNRLVNKRPGVGALEAAPLPPAKPETVGDGPSNRVEATGGGVAELTETTYADRLFHATYALTSTDGLFTVELRRVARMTLETGDGGSIYLTLANNA